MTAVLLGGAACGPKHFDPLSGTWTRGSTPEPPVRERRVVPAEKRQRVADNGNAAAVHAARGRKIFDLYCTSCHPNGAAGAGPALTRPIDPTLLKIQVRRGTGAMPGFNERQIDDESFDALAEFLVSKTRPRSIARE